MRRHFRAARALTAAAATLATTAGCFNYVQVPPRDARPGAEVRVELAPPGAATLAPFVGPRATSLDGRLVTQSDSSLTLAVTTITRTTGVEESWPGDEVVVPASSVASVQSRRLARGRTGFLLGGLVALAVVVGALFAASEDINAGGRIPAGGGRQ